MELITMMASLLFVHFVADFVLQTDKMALNKSTSIKYLTYHCLMYALCFIWVSCLFAAIMFFSHMIIDFVTSRINAKLYKNNNRHWFFTMIGFDQFLHTSLVVVTFMLL